MLHIRQPLARPLLSFIFAKVAVRAEGIFLNDLQLIARLRHRDRVRLEAPRDVIYWAGLWGLTNQELRDAVAAVGPMAADVAAYLGQPINGEDLRRAGDTLTD